MTASKGISKYFENIEAGRGPPKSKKRNLFTSAIIIEWKRPKWATQTKQPDKNRTSKPHHTHLNPHAAHRKLEKETFFPVFQATDHPHFQLFITPQEPMDPLFAMMNTFCVKRRPSKLSAVAAIRFLFGTDFPAFGQTFSHLIPFFKLIINPPGTQS